jgi:hypothetical protein
MPAIVLLFAGMARSYKILAPLLQEPEQQTQGPLQLQRWIAQGM